MTYKQLSDEEAKQAQEYYDRISNSADAWGADEAAFPLRLLEQCRRANKLSIAIMRVDCFLIGKPGFDYLRDALSEYLGEKEPTPGEDGG